MYGCGEDWSVRELFRMSESSPGVYPTQAPLSSPKKIVLFPPAARPPPYTEQGGPVG